LRFWGWALDGALTNALNFALEKDVTITGYWYTPASSGGKVMITVRRHIPLFSSPTVPQQTLFSEAIQETA